MLIWEKYNKNWIVIICVGLLILLFCASRKTTQNRSVVKIRGGVGDTRLQGSTPRPRTQKIRGQGKDQGQPYWGQNLSGPRRGMLEAKAKNQGHKRKCSPKKRSSEKFFRRSPEKTVFQKIFQALHKLWRTLKIVLSSSRGHSNFWGLEALRPRTSNSRKSSRTPPLVKTM